MAKPHDRNPLFPVSERWQAPFFWTKVLGRWTSNCFQLRNTSPNELLWILFVLQRSELTMCKSTRATAEVLVRHVTNLHASSKAGFHTTGCILAFSGFSGCDCYDFGPLVFQCYLWPLTMRKLFQQQGGQQNMKHLKHLNLSSNTST